MRAEKYRKLTAVASTLLIISLFFFYIYQQRTEHRMDEIKDYLDSIQREIIKKNETIKSLIENLSNKSERLERLTHRNEELLNKTYNLKKKNEALESNLSKYKEITTHLRDQIGEYREASVKYSLLAIDNEEGEIFPFSIGLTPGDGDITLAINNVEYKIDTQSSIRTAWKTAKRFTGNTFSGKDCIIEINYNKTLLLSVEGGSGGAPITLAIIAALEGKNIDQKVLMTGTISYDGSIGDVADVEEKVKTARENGASKVLIPQGNYVSVSGIEVEEVSNIEEAVEIVLS